MNNGNKGLLTILGILVSAVFLYLAFRDIEADKFWNSIRAVDLPYVLLAIPTYFAALAVIAWRWQFLLRAVSFVPLHALTQLVAICYMGNGVYPLRAGEALRIYLLKRNHRVQIASATTTVLVERAFDGIVMLSFILFSLRFIAINSPEVDAVVSIASPLFVGAVLFFFAMAAKPEILRAVVMLLRRALPQNLGAMVHSLAEDTITGLSALRKPSHLLGAIFASFLTWTIEASVYWLVMFAFGLDYSFALALLIIGTVNLAGVISASPGQVGVYEFVVSVILMAIGTAPATAVSYAVLVHLVIWAPTTLVGFALLVRQGMGWSDIARARNLDKD